MKLIFFFYYSAYIWLTEINFLLYASINNDISPSALYYLVWVIKFLHFRRYRWCHCYQEITSCLGMACVTEYSENQWYIKNVILIANNSLKEFLFFLSSSGKKKIKLEVFLESKVRTLKYLMQVTFFLSPISIKCLVNTLLKS